MKYPVSTRLLRAERLTRLAAGRPTYSSDGGRSSERAERRAAPKPARFPSGDRPTYSSDEGPT